MRNLNRLNMAGLMAGLMVATSAMAYTFQTETLVEQTDGNVTYVTGGIGEMETYELEMAKPYYNLHVINAAPAGAYVSDTSVIVEDSKGNDMLAVRTGPLLYANLPAGRYTLMAEQAGVVQTKKFTISAKKSADVRLIWDVAAE